MLPLLIFMEYYSGGDYDGDTKIIQTSTNKVLVILDEVDSSDFN